MNSRLLASSSAIAVLGIALAGCGGGSGGSGGQTTPTASSTNLNSAASKAAIASLYQRFFNEPQTQAVTDLENGASMSKAIKIASKLKGKNSQEAKVSAVTISTTTKPPTATVTYSLFVNNKPTPIKNGTGYAVYENGKWLFARKTFCQLVGLGTGTTPPGCANA